MGGTRCQTLEGVCRYTIVIIIIIIATGLTDFVLLLEGGDLPPTMVVLSFELSHARWGDTRATIQVHRFFFLQIF